MAVAQGTIVSSRFRLTRVLADGGMGTVWLARHTGLDVDCAVKFLQPALVADAELVARFEREARAAAQIKSSHVVRIIDYGVFERTPYIAMEYLEGEDLAQRIAKVGALPAAVTLSILSQVSRALMKAHAAGIVHRDLKPENIFLVQEDDEEIAKIVDFGIAKDFGSSLALTHHGTLLGTPTYMSPEQIQGEAGLDHRADIWSLAVVAFECLTGRPPVMGRHPMEIATEIVLRHLPLPSSIAPLLPPEVDDWWRRATAPVIGDRFKSARELCDALSRALHLERGASAQRWSRVDISPSPSGVIAAEAMAPIRTIPTPIKGLGGEAEKIATQPTLHIRRSLSLAGTASVMRTLGRNPRSFWLAAGAAIAAALVIVGVAAVRPPKSAPAMTSSAPPIPTPAAAIPDDAPPTPAAAPSAAAPVASAEITPPPEPVASTAASARPVAAPSSPRRSAPKSRTNGDHVWLKR